MYKLNNFLLSALKLINKQEFTVFIQLTNNNSLFKTLKVHEVY
jgi:hypothetical protein